MHSNFTPRSNHFFSLPSTDSKLIFFGLQGFVQWSLADLFNEVFFTRPEDEVASEYKQVMDSHLDEDVVAAPVLTIINAQPESF